MIIGHSMSKLNHHQSMTAENNLLRIFVHDSLMKDLETSPHSEEARLLDEASTMDEALDLFNDYFSGSRSVPGLIFLNLKLSPRETQLLSEPFETVRPPSHPLIILASVSGEPGMDEETLNENHITYFGRHSDLRKDGLLADYFRLSPSPLWCAAENDTAH